MDFFGVGGCDRFGHASGEDPGGKRRGAGSAVRGGTARLSVQKMMQFVVRISLADSAARGGPDVRVAKDEVQLVRMGLHALHTHMSSGASSVNHIHQRLPCWCHVSRRYAQGSGRPDSLDPRPHFAPGCVSATLRIPLGVGTPHPAMNLAAGRLHDTT